MKSGMRSSETEIKKSLKEQWLNARREELLPTGYFHVVFTLPHLFNPFIHYSKNRLLGYAKRPFSGPEKVLDYLSPDCLRAKWKGFFYLPGPQR